MKGNQKTSDILKNILVGLFSLLILLIFVLAGGNVFIIQVSFIIFLGWISFLLKVIPYIFVNKLMLVESLVIVLILIGSVHWFLSWFYENYNSSTKNEAITKSRWKFKWTFTGITIFFLMFIISISITGLIHEISWLRQTPLTEYSFFYGGETEKILRKMGIGLDAYYQENNHLPIVSQPVPFKEIKIPQKYYDGVVIDQWGMPILYDCSDGKSYTLRSYGRNRILGSGMDKFDDLVYIDGQVLRSDLKRNKNY
ncbi:MAG: hypothetical protein HGA42_17650 [Nostocales cyanobacterium W4_Combined_metabat2_030]|nr:hypothetical protein [Nostocales cyanobacterium W4_Combined_metabat2_030]